MKKKYILGGIIGALLLCGSLRISRKNFTIVIDPGHGGKDPGTVGLSGSYEKDIALDIGRILKRSLRLKGYRVVMTRDSDEFIELSRRAEIGNLNKADLFLSIHCNALEDNNTMEGIQVLYYPSPDNEVFAQELLGEITKSASAVNKGVVPRENLIVLKETRNKSFVLELGFLTTGSEEDRLLDRAYKKSLVNGIVNFIKLEERQLRN